MMILASEMTSSYVAAVVVTGLVVVFSCLVILVLFLYIMGAVFNRIKKSKSQGSLGSDVKNVSAAKIELTKMSAAAIEPAGINEEIVAAISAAIAMIGESSGKKLLIKSISKSGIRRNSWAQAGKIDNTRPF